ncbi:hypothetical protein KC19_7G137200 [Ceratodon purpureus]|nr:hypothetical protein KC19_7G137200 [Ceratodon purpureus]
MRSCSVDQLGSGEMAIALCIMIIFGGTLVVANDPYQYEDWTVSYIDASPLGVMQKVIAINDQFPGPQLETTTNYNLVIRVHNELDEPLLITWDGIQQRKNAWQDGVAGTNCPIQPGRSWTYNFKMKDQIGSYYYYPSLLFQKAAGGFGSIRVNPRRNIPCPFAPPAADFVVLIGDWYKTDHKTMRSVLDEGRLLGSPDGVLINGRGPLESSFTVEQGKTYRLRISNVGLTQTLNFRIQGHRLLLVETEGSYVAQTYYSTLDVHVGQSYSVLVTMDQSIPADFHIVASSRFTWPTLYGLAVLHYSTSHRGLVSRDLPPAPNDVQSSYEQARSIRMNLTAGAARPNPQGSYHYGQIKVNKTYVFANSALKVKGKQRFMVNGVSSLRPSTPLKLADYLKIDGVFHVGSIPDHPIDWATPSVASSVVAGDFRAFVEIVFQNPENALQSWHINGYAFFVVGMGPGRWSRESQRGYNLVDAVARTTTQV